MAHPPEATRIDERLARLLEVERSLEARVRAAEAAATARVAEAREAARHAERGDLETAARTEEKEDLDCHAAEQSQIAQESAARIARLSAVTDAVVDWLARRTVAAVLARGARRP